MQSLQQMPTGSGRLSLMEKWCVCTGLRLQPPWQKVNDNITTTMAGGRPFHFKTETDACQSEAGFHVHYSVLVRPHYLPKHCTEWSIKIAQSLMHFATVCRRIMQFSPKCSEMNW